VRRVVAGKRVAWVAWLSVLPVDRRGDLEQVVWNRLCDWYVRAVTVQLRVRPQATIAERSSGRLRDHRETVSSAVVVTGRFQARRYAVACEDATVSSADFSIEGSVFPRLSARLNMPLQAFADSENLGGSGPVSKTSDNEHTSPALRDGSGPSTHSHVLSVQHSVGPPIPEFAQRPEEGAKVPSSATRQDTGNIFPDNPSRLEPSSNRKVCEHEVAARICEPLPEAGDAEGLAWCSSDQNVECFWLNGPLLKLCHIAVVRYGRKPMRQHGARKWFDLAEADWLPADVMPRD
jgi:hypothetical protein